MRIAGKCPLENGESYIRTELENFDKDKIRNLDIESMRKEFCKNVCKNIVC